MPRERYTSYKARTTSTGGQGDFYGKTTFSLWRDELWQE